MARRYLFVSLLLCCLVSWGCARLPRVSRPEPALPESELQLDSLQGMTRGVPTVFLPAVEAIITALEEGENNTARGALNALLRRGPDARTLKLARGFERILDGRQRVGWMDLRLEAIENPELAAHFRLELVVSLRGKEDLFYRPGGARLFAQQAAVTPDGSGQRSSRRDAIPFPEEVHLRAGEEARFELAQLVLEPPAGVLASSSRLRLDLLPGQFRMADGRYLPAQSVPAPRLELVRLAGELPNGTLEPAELVQYAEGADLFLPALMERAVRIAPERREETLDLLSDLVATTDSVRLEQLVPALRWLARTDGPGGSAEAWRRYMGRRAWRASRKPSGSSLALPSQL